MTDPTTTIREALDILYDFIELDGTTYAGPDPKTFRVALAQLIQGRADSSARITALESAINRSAGALMSAAGQFRFYADEHTKKDATEKAATNNRWADELSREADETRAVSEKIDG